MLFLSFASFLPFCEPQVGLEPVLWVPICAQFSVLWRKNLCINQRPQCLAYLEQKCVSQRKNKIYFSHKVKYKRICQTKNKVILECTSIFTSKSKRWLIKIKSCNFLEYLKPWPDSPTNQRELWQERSKLQVTQAWPLEFIDDIYLLQVISLADGLICWYLKSISKLILWYAKI